MYGKIIGLGLKYWVNAQRQPAGKTGRYRTSDGRESLMTRLPGELSGGQRQRVALARCGTRTASAAAG